MTDLVIPPEGHYYDIERDLMDNEPPGLFPEDQNSYWGQIRHVFAEHLQLNIADALAQWYINLDPRTVVREDMPEWEEMLGIPEIPHDFVSGVPDEYRRAIILTRYEKGPFSRARRNRVIEQFISATFGVALTFGSDGILMDAAGRPLYADTIALASSYRVYEDVRNYAYEVRIINTITPDIATMLRELKRITPAPTSANVTINNSLAGTAILDYSKDVLNDQPDVYYQLEGGSIATDSSGNGRTATNTGVTAATGLVPNRSGANRAGAFNGSARLDVGVPVAANFTVELTFTLTSLPTAGHVWWVYISGGASGLYIQPDGAIVLAGASGYAVKQGSLSAGTTYHLVIRAKNNVVSMLMNGAWQGVTHGVPVYGSTIGMTIGGLASAGDSVVGTIDEYSFYNRPLSDDRMMSHFKTANNVL